MPKPQQLTRRQQQALETRNHLFKVAVTLFSKHGFDAVSVDEIVAQAGTSKGAFYTYFASKEQVVIEHYKQIDDYYLEIYDDIMKPPSATARLMEFVRRQQVFVNDRMGVDVLRIVYYSTLKSSEGKKLIADDNRPLYRIIREIIEGGQKSGEFRADISAKELTTMMVRCIRGLFYDWCRQDGDFDLIDHGQRFFAAVIDGLLRSHVQR